MTGLWIAAVAMTALALAAVVAPLIGRGRAPRARRREYDLTVYKDQLAEIDRDLERGLLDAAEADAARTEIQRRILAAADSEGEATAAAPTGRGLAAVLGVALPVAAFGLYFALGSPQAPNFPIAERTAPATAGHDRGLDRDSVMKLAERLLARLESGAGDAQGWVLLGKTYLNVNETEAAVAAFRRAFDLSGGRADIATDYAEALVLAAGGQVPDEARDLFRGIVEAEPLNPRARYYAGLALAQRGDIKGALQAWVDLKALTPPGAPWLATVDEQIGRAAEDLGVAPWSVKPSAEVAALAKPAPAAPPAPAITGAPSATPGPTADDMAAASQMPAADRRRMIRAMVQRLADRLETEPDDLDGWRRLARSYRVLGEAGKAAEAEARVKVLEARREARGDARGDAKGAPTSPPSAVQPGGQPGPTAEDMEAASRMTAGERTEMIRAMVERLAERLKDEPDDEAGWRRLARSYRVLGETGKAKEALARAEALAAKAR